MELTAGGIRLDTRPERFGFLRDSTSLLSDVEALRAQMDRDGYLFLPGFLDREGVREVRLAICKVLEAESLLDPQFPMEQAIARSGLELYFRADIANGGPASHLLKQVIYGERMMSFFDRFLGVKATHFDYTWMRAIAPGKGTSPHCDIVYMGRGTPNLYTSWVPLGDVPLNVGGLLLLEGSHQNRELRSTYCHLDVDTTCRNRPSDNTLSAAGFLESGAISSDISGIRGQIGGRLLTAEQYRMGDLLIFSAFTVHGSLDNQSREIRLSSDSRYQSEDEPVDERWIGAKPPGHGALVRDLVC